MLVSLTSRDAAACREWTWRNVCWQALSHCRESQTMESDTWPMECALNEILQVLELDNCPLITDNALELLRWPVTWLIQITLLVPKLLSMCCSIWKLGKKGPWNGVTTYQWHYTCSGMVVFQQGLNQATQILPCSRPVLVYSLTFILTLSSSKLKLDWPTFFLGI